MPNTFVHLEPRYRFTVTGWQNFSCEIQDKDKRREILCIEAQGTFVGPIEPEEFLNEYLRGAALLPPLPVQVDFSGVPIGQGEQPMYGPLQQVAAQLCPALTYLITANKLDSDSGLMLDACILPHDVVDEGHLFHKFTSYIEVKFTNEDDAF